MRPPIPKPPRDKGVLRRGIEGVLLLAMMIAVTWLIIATGGTESGYSYLMLAPVLLAGVIDGVRGGVITGVVGGLLLAPFMPDALLAAKFEQQAAIEWLVRLGVFTGGGAFIGVWCRQLRHHAAALRFHPNTQLRNEVGFQNDLDERLRTRDPSSAEIGVVLVRATDLKELVDSVGIEVGDRMLIAMADRIERIGPDISVAYRLSGSSLAFIVETRDLHGLDELVEAVHEAAGMPIYIDRAPMRIEPAVGMSYCHQPTERCVARELLRRSRLALHQAMSLSLPWTNYSSGFDQDTSQTFELLGDIERGLRNAEFELHYQPKINLADTSPAGFEALIRWRCGDGGFQSPGDYMPKLEKTSLIDQVSRFVVQTTVECARRGFLVPVSINLAPRNLANEAFIDALIQTLEQRGMPGEWLEVEVTEAALMRQPENAITMLARLRGHGIGVSIDDFGTGYSSFAYLRRLPATNLKIDREFIQYLETDGSSRKLVWAMIECAHALTMTVTAEGVETEQQARLLAEYGCDMGQGFLWCAARPEPQLAHWLDGTRGDAGLASPVSTQPVPHAT